MTKLQEKIEYFREKQRAIVDLDRQLNNAKAEYKGEMKAAFGVADGEPVNILEVVELVGKVIELQQ